MSDIKPWKEAVRLHPDVESEQRVISTYVIDLGTLGEKDLNVSQRDGDYLEVFSAKRNTSGRQKMRW